MANKPKQRMPREDRAKQFMPFSALKGLEEALRNKERQVVEKKELSEEASRELSQKLSCVRKGDIISVVYYRDGTYITCQGKVTGIDTVYKTLTVVKTEIPMENIFEIGKCEASK